METTFKLKKIGHTGFEDGLFTIQLDNDYLQGLTNIDGFEFLQVLWWGHLSDDDSQRNMLTFNKPYKKGPDLLGVFATRSEARPNPILMTTIQVINIDKENGLIYTPYIDAEPGSAVLDIKPYHRVERVAECEVPNWCQHWPKNYEEAGSFDWAAEFNF